MTVTTSVAVIFYELRMSSELAMNPYILIVSGGIACGKSTFVDSWVARNAEVHVFCADEAVHELYTDVKVAKQVAAIAGMEVLSDDGSVNRTMLGTKVFADGLLRQNLEALIHPMVRKKFQQSVLEAIKQGAQWMLADIPLYFEGGGEFVANLKHNSHLISTLVVACSEATQIERLQSRNGFDKTRSESILRSQMPVAEKILKADFVIWNEGAQQVLNRQTELLSRTLEVLRK